MGNMAREITSGLSDECLPGVQLSGNSGVGRSLTLFKTVTKPMLKDLLVFIHSCPTCLGGRTSLCTQQVLSAHAIPSCGNCFM